MFKPVTLVLLVTAITTLFRRYKGENGRLLRVIRRDDGAYYLTLAGQSKPPGCNVWHSAYAIFESKILSTATSEFGRDYACVHVGVLCTLWYTHTSHSLVI